MLGKNELPSDGPGRSRPGREQGRLEKIELHTNTERACGPQSQLSSLTLPTFSNLLLPVLPTEKPGGMQVSHEVRAHENVWHTVGIQGVLICFLPKHSQAL